MALARHLTLPGSLEGCTEALGLTTVKDKRGKSLIKLFCAPQWATAKQRKAGTLEIYWADRTSHPEEWQAFGEYAMVDVVTMRDALSVMESYGPLPAQERMLWQLDWIINNRGLPVDAEYVNRASAMINASDAKTLITLGRVMGCANPNSVAQLKAWLAAQGCPMASVAAGAVAEALEGELPDEVRAVLQARQQLGGAGSKKLAAIQALVSADGRLRNQFTFCGTRTGRWSSRGVQVQNLPRGSQLASQHCESLTEAIRSGAPLPVQIDVVDAVTSTIRSSFRVRPGHRFLISDYSSIENRVLAWVAACEQMLQVFRKGLDPYKAFAVHLFAKPYDEITKTERMIAKPATLGSGHGASAPRLAEYARTMGVELDEKTAACHVDVFRQTYKEVPALWYSFGDYAERAVRDGNRYSHFSGTCFDARDARFLAVRLPSGWSLYYLSPKLRPR